MTSDGVSSSSRVGWMPAEHVTGLEINLDAEQCRVLDLGLHVIKVSPKPVPKKVIEDQRADLLRQ